MPVLVCLVSSNKGKLREFEEVLQRSILSMPFINPEIQGTPRDIILAKAVSVTQIMEDTQEASKYVFLIEDTALMCNGLGGLPGPYVKEFQDKIGSKGIHDMLKFNDDKSCRALCSIALCRLGHPIEIIERECNGTIVEPDGSNGFGWDNIFKPDGYNVTFAQMDAETKNLISHRGQALNEVKKRLTEYDNETQQ